MKIARLTRILGGLLLLCCITTQASAQFRTLVPIASPKSQADAMPEGAVAVEEFSPIPRSVVEPQLEMILAKWNTPEMASTLSDQFYDRTRLLDLVNTEIPRDARLRVLSLQNVRTLQQYELPAANSESPAKVSIVSATARTQLEFNSPTGLVRLPGTNEFILKVTQPAPRN